MCGAVLALNGVYSPHRMIKRQSHLISEPDVMPGHFAERLRLLGTSGKAQALREAETLPADTVQLVKARTEQHIDATTPTGRLVLPDDITSGRPWPVS